MSNQYYPSNSIAGASLPQFMSQNMTEQSPFLSQMTFDVSNPEPRCPCVLLLDVSGSMAGSPIKQLNQGLIEFAHCLQSDPLASVRVETAVISFGNQVTLENDFITAGQFQPHTLTANGATPMGQAVNVGLDMLTQRKQIYKQNGVAYYRPWLFMITDGAPTDKDVWPSAAARAKQADASKAVGFFTVGVQNADMATLQMFSNRPPVHLKGLNFRDMFVWLSQSLASVSRSQPGQQVPLDQQAAIGPTGWGEV